MGQCESLCFPCEVMFLHKKVISTCDIHAFVFPLKEKAVWGLCVTFLSTSSAFHFFRPTAFTSPANASSNMNLFTWIHQLFAPCDLGNNICWPYLFSPCFKVNAVLWACFSITSIWGWVLSTVLEQKMLHKQPLFPQTVIYFFLPTHASLIHRAGKRLASSISSDSIHTCSTDTCTDVGENLTPRY